MYRVKPIGSMCQPYDSSIDPERRLVTHCFSYRPQSANPGGPGALQLERYHRGEGDPIRCSISGEYFPSSRIVQTAAKGLVGDIYASRGNYPPDEEF